MRAAGGRSAADFRSGAGLYALSGGCAIARSIGRMVDDGGEIEMGFSARPKRGAFVRGRVDRDLCGYCGRGPFTGTDRRGVRDRSGPSRNHLSGEYGAWVPCAAGRLEPVAFVLSVQQADGGSHALSGANAAGVDAGGALHYLCPVAHDFSAANVPVIEGYPLTALNGWRKGDLVAVLEFVIAGLIIDADGCKERFAHGAEFGKA